VAFIIGINVQLDTVDFELVPITNRQQIQPKESAWRDQADFTE